MHVFPVPDRLGRSDDAYDEERVLATVSLSYPLKRDNSVVSITKV